MKVELGECLGAVECCDGVCVDSRDHSSPFNRLDQLWEKWSYYRVTIPCQRWHLEFFPSCLSMEVVVEL